MQQMLRVAIDVGPGVDEQEKIGPSVGITVAMPGRSTPGNMRSLNLGRGDKRARVAGRNQRLRAALGQQSDAREIEESFLRRTASIALSAMSTTCEA
jgi:hypothetical protein